MTTTIDQAVTSLVASPCPVLIVDTCALLDIIRAPLHNLVDTVRAARDLKALVAQEFVRLFVSDLVPHEWEENLDTTRNAGLAGIQAFTGTWQIAFDLGYRVPDLPAVPPDGLILELENLSRELLGMATILDRDAAGMSWAIDRVLNKQRPSSGKGLVKDSHILGHTLELCERLGTKYSYARIFVSSNWSDFAGSNRSIFHSHILPYSTRVELWYALSLDVALSNLRILEQIPQ